MRMSEQERYVLLDQYEQQARATGYRVIAGVDEAGRGPLAGPVAAAAVILDPVRPILGLNDSKKLSEAKRERLFDQIQEQALAYAVILVDAGEIDRINILQATKQAMRQAIASLAIQPDLLLIDAVALDQVPGDVWPIVKGDAKSNSIAAASILAKVTRDRLMQAYDSQYPDYGFARHKGYGTALHYAAIHQHGLTPIHRTSFLTNLSEHVAP
ncbi:MAG: ribonuclease HII [Eubacteriales bacterium]|nr:ribonuclease HII [Eubacteriales bacterium]